MRGFLFPKTISLTVAKKLINTKLFHIMFRKYMKLCDMSLKYALDEISDDEEFKNVLAYAFGDFGRYVFADHPVNTQRHIYVVSTSPRRRNDVVTKLYICWVISGKYILRKIISLKGTN